MSDYKCPHCEYYMWEGNDFYECDIQDKVSKLERENAELRSTLQEIKRILIFHKQELEECLHNDIDGKILDLINKAESEG